MRSAFLWSSICFMLWCSPGSAFAQDRSRRELNFPDVYGYVPIKGDFHMHTVFSDGSVWPTIRVQEAWRDGLDAIAITDHIEYQPHKADVSTNFNRSFEIAQPAADSLGLLLVRSAEITRGEPPGHLNALFLTDIPALQTTNYQDEVRLAAEQGAFLFWNHPGWKQPGGKSVWYKEQGEFLEKGWLRGLEIVNGADYDAIVHEWAARKNLVIMGNSDAHNPIDLDYDSAAETHRPVTVVYAKEKSLAALKEGLMSRRTVVWSGTNLFGGEEYLRPIFEKSIRILNPSVAIKGKGRALLQVYNQAPCAFTLRQTGAVKAVSLPKNLVLPSGRTVTIEVRSTMADLNETRSLSLPFKVLNLRPAPRESLAVDLQVTVAFTPADK